MYQSSNEGALVKTCVFAFPLVVDFNYLLCLHADTLIQAPASMMKMMSTRMMTPVITTTMTRMTKMVTTMTSTTWTTWRMC